MARSAHFRAGILILIPFSAAAQCSEAQNKEREAMGHVTLRKRRSGETPLKPGVTFDAGSRFHH